MASFRDYLTAEGERMLAKAVAGTKITFTKCVLGSGYMNPGTYEKNVTDVIAKEQEVPIQSVTVNSNDSVLVTAYFNNKKVTKGFYCREKGIYMSDGKEEVLAIYGNNGSEAEFIDTGDVCVVEKMIKSVLEITDEERANIEIVDALYEFAPVIEPDTATIADFVTTLTARTMKIGQRVILNKSIAYTYVGDDPTDVACYIAGSGAQLSDIYDKEIPNGNADGGIGASQNALAKVYTELTGHEEKIVYGESGVHGIRYWEGVLQVLDADGNWIDIDANGGGLAPGDCTNLRVKVGNGKLTLFWSDPEDITADGQVVCRWAGTKLVQKAGSYPKNPKDGVVLVNNQTRDAYKDNGFVVTGLQNNTTYYFTLFPYSDKNAVNISSANRMTGTPQPYRKMTVKIDLSNSNPATCCTYADDAVDMAAGSADWDTFFGHYPCLFKNGAEVGKLDPNDFTKFSDGSDADITSGDAGDVMTAFPRRGLTINTVDDIVTVSMTDDPDNDDFKYYAHSRGEVKKDKFYFGAYKGYLNGIKLRSVTGNTPRYGATIGKFREYAQANGSGYDISGFYQITYLQAMYLLKYKNLDSQSMIGRGMTGRVSNYPFASGGTEAYGMDCELIKQTNPTYMTDGEHHVKLFGIEDFWGNIYEFVDGVYCNGSYNILAATDNFDDYGSGYTTIGQVATDAISGYMSKIQGTSELGFIPKQCNGSETTYFCDMASLNKSCNAAFGNYWGSNYTITGAFHLRFYLDASYSNSYVGARLMYL